MYVKYTVDVIPLCNILCGLLSCYSSPKCKKCCRLFTHCYTVHDNLDHQMYNELSLLPKVCPLYELVAILIVKFLWGEVNWLHDWFGYTRTISNVTQQPKWGVTHSSGSYAPEKELYSSSYNAQSANVCKTVMRRGVFL